MANHIKRITLFAGTTGAVGKNDDTVLQRIWAKFQTKVICRASDGRVLTYYGFYDKNRNGVWDEGTDTDRNSPEKCKFTSAENLVKETNGQCHSWAEFMHQVLCAQGLRSINGKLTLRVDLETSKTGYQSYDYFAVKNWEKYGPCIHWEIVSMNAGINGKDLISQLHVGEAQDILGASGQGNSPNPPSNFKNHYIIRCCGELYDPSYALGPFHEHLQYEHAAFDGAIRIIGDDDGNSNSLLYALPQSCINEYDEGPFP